MSDFTTTTLDQAILDPRKRVRYSTGLVLGVDEFQQEQDYLMERDKRHQRGLHGYGTVNGLDVGVRIRDGEPEVLVAPGLAVDRLGRDMCVTSPQCAPLNDWLAANDEAVRAALGSPPDDLPIYVVLCYRDCATDFVPIPGSPCRSEDDATAASRFADDFELRLELEPPVGVEEEVVRRFGALLRRLRLTDGGPGLSAEELADLVRALPEIADPDPFGPPLPIAPAEAADLLRHIFRVWTTEVRPNLGGEGGCRAPDDACLLLARIDLGLIPEGDVLILDTDAEGPVADVQEDVRPLLLSTRVLQEWLMFLGGPSPEGPGSFSFPDGDVLLALNDLIDVETAPAPGDVLTWDDDTSSWTSSPVAGGTTDHGELGGLADDDHTQYHTDARGDARYALLNHNHALPSLTDLDAGGDLGGLYPDPSVVGIRGHSVATAVPEEGQVLTWDDEAEEWTPRGSQDGVTAHDDLTGLGQDDHLQYHTDARGDARYAPRGHTHAFPSLTDLDAGGDLDGFYPDPAVVRLQGRRIAATAPDEGQVLIWDVEAQTWTPTDLPAAEGRFVRAEMGSYAIVAAGFFEITGLQGRVERRGPVYNDLNAVLFNGTAGNYRLTFRGYQNPDRSEDELMYIVKGTIKDAEVRGTPRATFEFVRFFNEDENEPEGILVRVLDIAGRPLRSGHGFMIEISAYGELPG